MWSPEELEQRLRRVGEERYHDKHPFNLRMHAGTLTREELQTWVRNRYYYQTRIPVKDGLILSKATDSAFRREWVHRLHDHDGQEPGKGGLEQWLELAHAVGLQRTEVASLRSVLPGVRVACDDYVRFVESNDLLASVAASLTEMFAGPIMRRRIAAFEQHYPWVLTEGLRYFESRTQKAPRDAAFGLRFVREHAKTADEQARCVAALERKCEILWRLLDAVEAAGRRPRFSRHAELRTETTPDQVLVVLPERAVRLNASGREILEMCDGAHSAGEIARALGSRHPEIEQVESDVHHFLEQMERVGVLEVAA